MFKVIIGVIINILLAALIDNKVIFYSYIIILFIFRIVFNKLLNILIIRTRYNTTLRYNNNYN